MKNFSAFDINFKKLNKRKTKAAFLIIPIAILVGLGIIISSQVSNIQSALDQNVFSEIEEESTVLTIEYQAEEFTPGRGGPRGMSPGSFGSMQTAFNESDLDQIKEIEHVQTAAINYSIPGLSASSADLFENITNSFPNLTALDEDLAATFTTGDFSYIQEEPIPIILNASSFIEVYEDWDGQDEISIDFRGMGDPAERDTDETDPMEEMQNSSPIKTRAIDYEKDDLIGKTFTIDFGGVDDIATYEFTREEGSTIFSKLSDSEQAELEAEQRDATDDYWDYDELATPVSYTFVVAGLIEDEDVNSTYIPEEFASKVMADLISKQLSVRTSSSLDADTIEANFSGIYYDGTELSTSINAGGFGMPSNFGGGPGGGSAMDQSQSDTYQIPGLVIEISETDSSISGIYGDSGVLDDSAKTGETISIQIDSIKHREDVVKELNKQGFAFQDLSDLDVLARVQSTLDQTSKGLIIAFIVISSGVVILTMSKFVSESTREIGIFRAVGFTKKNILSIFLLQGIIYTAVGYILGMILGGLGNILISPVVFKWFQSFVDGTVKQTVNVTGEVDASIFRSFDIGTIVLLSALLMAITIILSYIPSLKASNVSPVEAIKSE